MPCARLLPCTHVHGTGGQRNGGTSAGLCGKPVVTEKVHTTTDNCGRASLPPPDSGASRAPGPTSRPQHAQHARPAHTAGGAAPDQPPLLPSCPREWRLRRGSEPPPCASAPRIPPRQARPPSARPLLAPAPLLESPPSAGASGRQTAAWAGPRPLIADRRAALRGTQPWLATAAAAARLQGAAGARVWQQQVGCR